MFKKWPDSTMDVLLSSVLCNLKLYDILNLVIKSLSFM